MVDEFTRAALAIRVERRLGSAQVLEVLAELMLARGVPGHIRSDNGPEGGLNRSSQRSGGGGCDDDEGTAF